MNSNLMSAGVVSPLPPMTSHFDNSFNGMQTLGSYSSQSFRQGTIPMASLIESAVQKVYSELHRLIDILPTKSSDDKKVELALFMSRTRHLFIRLLALVKWANSAPKIDKCEKILNQLNHQSLILLDTANNLSRMAKETLVGARLPPFAIVLATDVLTCKTYIRLPTCIELVPSTTMNKWEKLEALSDLNKLIQYRLSTAVLPLQMRTVSIENGRAIFLVPNEFQISLTLMSDVLDFPWRILNLKILVNEPLTGNGRPLVHPLQVQHLQQQLQSRILFRNVDKKPTLLHLYEMLHSFCINLQLGVLHEQADRLSLEHPDDVICQSAPSPLIVSYWRSRETIDETTYSISIQVNAKDENQSLYITHAPELPLSSQQAISGILKSDFLSMGSIISRTLVVRSRQLLEELRLYLLALSPGPIHININPPALHIPLLNPCLQSELLSIHLSPFSGFLHASLPLFSSTLNKSQDSPSAEIESGLLSDLSALISDFRKKLARGELAQLLVQLRLRLGRERIRRSVRNADVPTCNSLPFQPGWTAELPPSIVNMTPPVCPDNLVFVKLLKSNDHYLVVEPISRGLGLVYRHLVVSATPLHRSGSVMRTQFDSTPATPIFLKPLSWRLLDTEKVLAFSTGLEPEDVVSEHYRMRQTQLDQKRKATLKMLSALRQQQYPEIAEDETEEPKAKRPRFPSCAPTERSVVSVDDIDDSEEANVDNVGHVPPLCKIVTIARDLILMHAVIEQLNRFGIQHSGIGLEAGKTMCVIPIHKFPEDKAHSSPSLSALISHCTLHIQRKLGLWWQLEIQLSRCPLAGICICSDAPSCATISLCHPMTRLESVGDVVRFFLQEWRLRCAVYVAASQLALPDNVPQDVKVVQFMDLKSIIFSYGPQNQFYLRLVQVSDIRIELHLYTSADNTMSQTNPHVIMQEHLLKLINRTQSIAKLLRVVSATLGFVMALDSLKDSILIFQTLSSPGSLMKNLNLVATSLHSVHLIYRNHSALRISLLSPDPNSPPHSDSPGDQILLDDVTESVLGRNQPIPQFMEFVGSLGPDRTTQHGFPRSCLSLSRFNALVTPCSGITTSPLECYLSGSFYFYLIECTLASDASLHFNENAPLRLQLLSNVCGLITVSSSSAVHKFRLAPNMDQSEISIWRLRLFSSDGLSPDLLEILDKYFNCIVSSSYPVVPNALTSFIRLLCLPSKALRDIICTVMQWELSPASCYAHNYRVRLNLVSSIDSQTTHLYASLPHSAPLIGAPSIFIHNTRVYMQLDLTQINSDPSQKASSYLPLLICYDAATNHVSQMVPAHHTDNADKERVDLINAMHLGQLRLDNRANLIANSAGNSGDANSTLGHYCESLAKHNKLW